MESRYRTILPVAGILLVLIVALIAFFITRRIRNATTATPSPTAISSNNLLLPTLAPTPRGTARPTIPPLSISPQTGDATAPTLGYSTAFDANGFREQTVHIASGTLLTWVNAGTTPQTLAVDGGNSGVLAPGEKFSFQFATPETVMVTLSSGKTQTIIVQ